MSYVLICSEPITAGLECPGGWIVSLHTPPFDIANVSPETAAQYFGAGFLIPVVPLVAALGAAVLLKLIRG